MIFRHGFLILAFTVAASLGAVRHVAADPIQISSGYVVVSGVQDFMSRGFLRAISFDFTTDAFRLTGSEFDGATQRVLAPSLVGITGYNPTSGPSSRVVVRSDLNVTATPGVAPSPFFLTGRLSIFNPLTGATLFDDIVSGSGTATFQFVQTPSGTSLLSGARYEFADVAPVPEPATMVMVGAGLAGLAARRRRRRALKA
ncbi:MAG: PEP-CTERM sorting domain-containing protein [Vicinamibacterales bacterium]